MEKVYKKRQALELLNSKKVDGIVANYNLCDYFIIDDHTRFLELIKKSKRKMFYEVIPKNHGVNFFFDIEIYKDKSEYFLEPKPIVDSCISTIYALYDKWNDLQEVPMKLKKQSIILQSHSLTKRSYHIIIRVTDETGYLIIFENVAILKELYSKFRFNKYKGDDSKNIVDPSVYKDGLFRTIYSTKNNEIRPLVKCDWSDEFDDIETFITNITDKHRIIKCNLGKLEYNRVLRGIAKENRIQTIDNSDLNTETETETEVVEINRIREGDVYIPQELTLVDKEIIRKFIRKNYKYRTNDIREILLNSEINAINVNLNDTFCFNIDREHRSNHQYIVIDAHSSKQKCHDSECGDFKHCEIKIEKFPKELNEILLKCLKVSEKELVLIQTALDECKMYIRENYDEDVQHVLFDKNKMMFRGTVQNPNLSKLIKGKCPECNVEHQISDGGYCLKCNTCNSIFPKNQIIPIDNRFKKLHNFWNAYQVNNGTINNIINIYNNVQTEDFSCEVTLDNCIFNDKKVTKIMNQILDGHKIVLLSELTSLIEQEFKYTNGDWFYFDGNIWKEDKESLEFRKRIVKLSLNFNKIKQYYEEKDKEKWKALIDNIKSLINKLHKTSFEDDIIKGAKMYYNDETFIRKLNSKKHLVPFSNGVYDLLRNEFRKTTKDDYINFTVGFDLFQVDQNNPEVYEFINNILPNQNVRDYVLKKLSECLNGDIPNTNFLMFIGDGANGKSQLLNLMKVTIGDFGEKVEVTLLTRKRNNANEANTEKVKLLNKRFAFLSEPEDGEKINIGLLKELTGSEEIVARGLYQGSISFVMEAKLFLACNELPEIKGEDTALWRRIRVIDFPSRFVDEPKESNEYKIDRTLPSRIREDLTWRQTFMNILLEYYNKDIKEPEEVKMKTNEYRADNDMKALFVQQYIKKGEEGIKWTDLLQQYSLWFCEEMGESIHKINKKELKQYFESKVFKTKSSPLRNIGRGWAGWELNDN